MENVFCICNCIMENQIKFATCTLLESALTWWNSHAKTVGPDVAYAMTWTNLKKKMTDNFMDAWWLLGIDGERRGSGVEVVKWRENGESRVVGSWREIRFWCYSSQFKSNKGCASWDRGKGTWGGRERSFGTIPVLAGVQEAIGEIGPPRPFKLSWHNSFIVRRSRTGKSPPPGGGHTTPGSNSFSFSLRVWDCVTGKELE
nr:reverse transcriptase domain-containing protein [Tanacetum cinerariifolium]